jgi:hypothetical protein
VVHREPYRGGGQPVFIATAICQFLRLKHRRGPMNAILAVAASMLTAAYYMLRDDQDYHDLGAAHFQRGDHDRLVAGPIRRLHHLGYEVTLRPAA